MGQIGSMWYNIGAKTADLEKGLANSKSGLSKMNDSFKSATGISLTAAAAWAAAGKALQFVINEAMEAEKADTKLNQVLDSTRGISGMTKESLDSVASSLSKVTVNSEETIKEAEALMLTFTKVGKEIFPDAIEAAMNMSAALGGDLQSKIIMVGKLLQDPNGMSAARRVGISFSEAQIEMGKAMFETGNIAGYQKMIIAELNTEFGGMAKAMGTTYAGQIAIFKNNVGELGEAVGKKLIPPLSEAVSALNKIMTVGEYFRTEVIKTGQRVHDEGKSFEYYHDSILKVAVATGRLRLEDAALIKGVEDGTIVVEEARQRVRLISEDIGLLTKYQWLALDATEQSTSSLMGWGSGLLGAKTAIEQTAEEMETMQDKLKTMLSITDKMTGMNSSYEESIKKIADTEYGTARERIEAIREVEKEHEIAKNKIILGYAEQLLAADGLSQQEVEFLLEKGAAMGVYSEDAIRDMRAVMQEAYNLTGALNGIPSNLNTSVTVYRNEVIGSPQGRKPGQAVMTPFANGGSFTVPAWAGNEGFNMGGVATASAGEEIRVSRQDTNRELLNEVRKLNSLFSTLPVLMAGALQRSF
jgi:hypothetical protein